MKIFYHSTYASVAMLTLHPNCSTRIAAQASSVAPVVRTSSQIKIWFPLEGRNLQAGLISKASFTFCHLLILSLAVWVAVNDFLRNSVGRTNGVRRDLSGRESCIPFCIPRAIISDWLNPLLSFLRQWRGMGTM